VVPFGRPVQPDDPSYLAISRPLHPELLETVTAIITRTVDAKLAGVAKQEDLDVATTRISHVESTATTLETAIKTSEELLREMALTQLDHHTKIHTLETAHALRIKSLEERIESMASLASRLSALRKRNLEDSTDSSLAGDNPEHG